MENTHPPIDLSLPAPGAALGGEAYDVSQYQAPQVSSADSWAAVLLRKLSFTDALLSVYLLALLRQFFWGMDNTLAWALTIPCALLLCGLHIKFREESERKLPLQFWVLVALPLLFVFAWRAASPDQDFDVLNYHLVNAVRGLKGWPFTAADFFPTLFQINPAPDMAAGIFRYLLGYRLGTLINYVALLWIALVIEKFLRSYIKNNWLRAVAILFVVSTEYILYLLNNYRVDLLTVPLLLEATYLSLNFAKVKSKSYTLVHVALFLGICVAFKLSNLTFALPLGLLCAWQAIRNRSQMRAASIAAAMAALIAPSVPFSLFMYRQTGNPLLPFFNRFFKSPLLPAVNLGDPVFGPRGLLEISLWPVWSFFVPDRISELSGIGLPYTGRISLAFIVCLLCICSRSISDKGTKALCLLTLASGWMWSLMTGNVRYGVYLEIIGGIALLAIFASLCSSERSQAIKRGSWQQVAFVVLFGGLLLVQMVAAYRIYFRNPPALYQVPYQVTVFEDFDGYKQDARDFLRDRSLTQYLSTEDRERFDKVEVWVNSYYTTNGVEVMLKPDIPMLAVCDYMNTLDYLRYDAGKKLFATKLPAVVDKRMYSLTNMSQGHLYDSLYFITRSGLTVGEITPVSIPYFSARQRKQMLLIEVLPPNKGAGMKEIDNLIKKTLLF